VQDVATAILLPVRLYLAKPFNRIARSEVIQLIQLAHFNFRLRFSAHRIRKRLLHSIASSFDFAWIRAEGYPRNSSYELANKELISTRVKKA